MKVTPVRAPNPLPLRAPSTARVARAARVGGVGCISAGPLLAAGLTLGLGLGLALSPVTMAKSTITFAFWGQKPVLLGYEESKKDFEKLHPSTNVKLLWIDPGAYPEKITTMFAGGTPPDALWYECNHGAMQPWILNNMLLPLDSYFKTDKLDVNALFGRQLMNAQKYDGKFFGKSGSIYGLPKGWNTDALFYNSTMFSNVGILPPSDEWTWDDLVEAGKKLTKRDSNGTFTQMAMMNPADP